MQRTGPAAHWYSQLLLTPFCGQGNRGPEMRREILDATGDVTVPRDEPSRLDPSLRIHSVSTVSSSTYYVPVLC